MPLYQAILLAIIQGLTEFLPISSTAHLILFPWLLGWAEPGLAFDVALHAGTLVAVLLYFLRTWLDLVAAGFGLHDPASVSLAEVHERRRLFWYLAIGTIPAGLAGFFFEHQIEQRLRNPLTIAISMIVVGLLMWWAEATSRLNRRMEAVTLGDSLGIGVAQATALIPGVSRAGITIVTGMWSGLTREAAARFSFLLATPVIAGAAGKELPKLLKLRHAGGMDLPLATLVASIAVSAIVGYLGIAFFLRYLQTRTLKIFIYYRIVFGIVILSLLFLHVGNAR